MGWLVGWLDPVFFSHGWFFFARACSQGLCFLIRAASPASPASLVLAKAAKGRFLLRSPVRLRWRRPSGLGAGGKPDTVEFWREKSGAVKKMRRILKKIQHCVGDWVAVGSLLGAGFSWEGRWLAVWSRYIMDSSPPGLVIQFCAAEGQK